MFRRFAPVAAALCVTLVLAGPAAAQSGKPDPEAVAIARQLIVETGSDKIGILMAESMSQQMATILRKTNPKESAIIDELLRTEFRPVLESEMPAIMGEIASLYALHFTADELREMLAFYRTPVGKKAVEKMPAILQQSMVMGQVWGQRVGQKAWEQFRAKAKEKGLQVPDRI